MRGDAANKDLATAQQMGVKNAGETFSLVIRRSLLDIRYLACPCRRDGIMNIEQGM